jgi:hypothetical protein
MQVMQGNGDMNKQFNTRIESVQRFIECIPLGAKIATLIFSQFYMGIELDRTNKANGSPRQFSMLACTAIKSAIPFLCGFFYSFCTHSHSNIVLIRH